MNKITKGALYLYLSVLMPFTAMACTSCSDEHYNDLEQMEENKNQHQDQNSNNVSGSYTEETDGIRFTLNGVEFKMITVEGGTFTMGHDNRQPNEKPEHQVTLSTFWIGETEVTQPLWKAVMGNNPSRSNRGDNYPVENVTWKICHEFVERLTAMMHEAGMPQEWEFRMPTEAQWEFAAKGGNKSKGYTYAGSNTLSEVGWNLNDGRESHPVRQKRPNELGIYDMSGNVYEWVADYFAPYTTEPQTDPCNLTRINSSRQVIKRGGSFWYNDAYRYTCTYRYAYYEDVTDESIGFRLVLKKPLNKYFIVDSFPLEVCKFGRARYSRCFRAYGADYGRCPSKKEVYFGYKVHAMITLEGYITNFEITPASTDDRDGLRDMLENETNMVIIGDKGYISEKLSDEMKCKGICVMALKRSNSKNNWTKPIRQLIFKLRRRVETVFSQLSLQLNSERVLAKSFQGLCTRLVNKMLAYNLCLAINSMFCENCDIGKIKKLIF